MSRECGGSVGVEHHADVLLFVARLVGGEAEQAQGAGAILIGEQLELQCAVDAEFGDRGAYRDATRQC